MKKLLLITALLAPSLCCAQGIVATGTLTMSQPKDCIEIEYTGTNPSKIDFYEAHGYEVSMLPDGTIKYSETIGTNNKVIFDAIIDSIKTYNLHEQWLLDDVDTQVKIAHQYHDLLENVLKVIDKDYAVTSGT